MIGLIIVVDVEVEVVGDVEVEEEKEEEVVSRDGIDEEGKELGKVSMSSFIITACSISYCFHRYTNLSICADSSSKVSEEVDSCVDLCPSPWSSPPPPSSHRWGDIFPAITSMKKSE